MRDRYERYVRSMISALARMGIDEPTEQREVYEFLYEFDCIRTGDYKAEKMRYVIEDTDQLSAGHVVVEDGASRRMLITKVIVGFAEVIWFERRHARRDIVHTSVLTLDKDQTWLPKT